MSHEEFGMMTAYCVTLGLALSEMWSPIDDVSNHKDIPRVSITPNKRIFGGFFFLCNSFRDTILNEVLLY